MKNLFPRLVVKMACKYIIDTNSFIESYKKFYAFDIAPNFWKQFEPYFAKDNILLLDVIYDEISKHGDDLFQWLKKQNKSKSTKANYINEYGQIINYINTCGYYNAKALHEWASNDHADPWVVAAGMATGGTIVTFETSWGAALAQGSSKVGKVRIGDIANHFGIRYENIYDFMREAGIRL